MNKPRYVKKAVLAVIMILTVAWMAVIFSFSASNATESTKVSTGTTRKLISSTDSQFGSMDEHTQNVRVSQLETKVRKMAHAFIFVVLGVLTGCYAVVYDKGRVWRNVAIGYAVCVIYAASDEIHQLFVPGRGAMVMDVLIDSIGAFVGTMLVVLVYLVVKAVKHTEKNK